MTGKSNANEPKTHVPTAHITKENMSDSLTSTVAPPVAPSSLPKFVTRPGFVVAILAALDL